ncbi:hypothetical protein F5148DRAFT_1209946 [Russula earlei]|uniref:Uncharacterized protein n=1 Tax=Russula earlei TaxID=71964 RepID=A0ACC0U5B3_9AGAM|nr:hypothetical protein F5148DRAFT_1209946 [Russula earlei]
MRTSSSAHVLALFCLAVGMAPLFAHASAPHLDTRQIGPAKGPRSRLKLTLHRGPSLDPKQIRPAKDETKLMLMSRAMNRQIAEMDAERGGNAPFELPPELRQQSHDRIMSGMEKHLAPLHNKHPTLISEQTLANLKSHHGLAK